MASKKLGKSACFIISILAIMLLAAIALFTENKDIPYASFLTAIVSLAAAYMSIQTANNGVKGKFYHQALDENKHDA